MHSDNKIEYVSKSFLFFHVFLTDFGLFIRYIFVIVATPSLQRPVQARVKILNCLGGGAPISILCLRRASRAHCTLTSIFFRLTVGTCKLHISELHGWFSLTAPSTDSWINPQAIKCADVQLATRQVAATLVLERLGIIVIITHQLTIAVSAIYTFAAAPFAHCVWIPC